MLNQNNLQKNPWSRLFCLVFILTSLGVNYGSFGYCLYRFRKSVENYFLSLKYSSAITLYILFRAFWFSFYSLVIITSLSTCTSVITTVSSKAPVSSLSFSDATELISSTCSVSFTSSVAGLPGLVSSFSSFIM